MKISLITFWQETEAIFDDVFFVFITRSMAAIRHQITFEGKKWTQIDGAGYRNLSTTDWSSEHYIMVITQVL